MTTLTRLDPFHELAVMRDAIERLWEDPFENKFMWSRRMTEFRPALDLMEDEQAYIVTAAVPGVKPEEIEVTLTDNVLTIKGEAKEDKEFNEKHYHVRERRYGSFVRSVALPIAVKPEAVEAVNENGVLTLRLPKSEEVKTNKI